MPLILFIIKKAKRKKKSPLSWRNKRPKVMWETCCFSKILHCSTFKIILGQPQPWFCSGLRHNREPWAWGVENFKFSSLQLPLHICWFRIPDLTDSRRIGGIQDPRMQRVEPNFNSVWTLTDHLLWARLVQGSRDQAVCSTGIFFNFDVYKHPDWTSAICQPHAWGISFSPYN